MKQKNLKFSVRYIMEKDYIDKEYGQYMDKNENFVKTD